MSNNKQRRFSFFSFLNIFKAKRPGPGGGDDSLDDAVHSTKIYPSDYHRSHSVHGRTQPLSAETWLVSSTSMHCSCEDADIVADPNINTKARDFIKERKFKTSESIAK